MASIRELCYYWGWILPELTVAAGAEHVAPQAVIDMIVDIANELAESAMDETADPDDLDARFLAAKEQIEAVADAARPLTAAIAAAMRRGYEGEDEDVD